ncbi:MAG: hypothetical protein ACLU4J_02325 [Butyricimonas paravirosa]
MADILFKGESAVGKRIECQKVVYTITGVVRDVSVFTTGIPEKFWFSNKYNSFTPSGDHYYDICVLFPRNVLLSRLNKSCTCAKGYIRPGKKG